MSIQAVAAVLGLEPMGPGERITLVALANHANDEGYCWPKRETIAREAGFTQLDTVTANLTKLVKRGLIERAVNGWAGSRGQIPKDQRPNLYRLLFIEGSPDDGDPYRGEGGSPHDGDPGLPTSQGPESSLRTISGTNNIPRNSSMGAGTVGVVGDAEAETNNDNEARNVAAAVRELMGCNEPGTDTPPTDNETRLVSEAMRNGWEMSDLCALLKQALESPTVRNPVGWYLARLRDVGGSPPERQQSGRLPEWNDIRTDDTPDDAPADVEERRVVNLACVKSLREELGR